MASRELRVIYESQVIDSCADTVIGSRGLRQECRALKEAVRRERWRDVRGMAVVDYTV